MFLDGELRKIQADKDLVSLRCDLQRQLVRLEVHSAWTAFLRKLTYATLGIQAGVLALSYLRKRRSQGS